MGKRARAAELIEPKGVATVGMRREEVSKMLNALEYNMGDKFKRSDDLRARSKLALERCRALPSEEKHAFLKQVQNNRQLTWITRLRGAHESSQSSSSSTTSVHFTLAEISTMNKYNTDTMEESESMQLLQGRTTTNARHDGSTKKQELSTLALSETTWSPKIRSWVRVRRPWRLSTHSRRPVSKSRTRWC